jgi:uncharacterized membrane protein YkoI
MTLSQALVRGMLGALLTLTAAAHAAAGDADDREQDAARAALQRGQALPLVRILAIVAQQVPGDVIEVELDDEDNTLVYEIKVLTANGRVREVEIDARTGKVLAIEDD